MAARWTWMALGLGLLTAAMAGAPTTAPLPAPPTAPAASAPRVPAMTAEEAARAFESIYGHDVARVASTADRKDDVDLAEHLMEAARSSADQPALLQIVCQKAFELAMADPAGHPTAAAACQLLAEAAPDRKLTALSNMVALRQRQLHAAAPDARGQAANDLFRATAALAEAQFEAGDYAAAVAGFRRAATLPATLAKIRKDEVQARIDQAAQMERTGLQLAEMKSRLAGSPDEASLRMRLIEMYAIEMDNPGEAVKLLSPQVDETTRTYLPLAAADVSAVALAACLELAQWHVDNARKASPAAKPAMFRRAKACYDSFLARHAEPDLLRTKAQLSLKLLESEVARLGASGAGTWIDLVSLLEMPKDAVGDWQVQGERLGVEPTARRGENKLTFPVLLEGSYEFQAKLEFRRGYGTVTIGLPVGGARPMLILDTLDREIFRFGPVADRWITGSSLGRPLQRLAAGVPYLVEARVSLDQAKNEAEVSIKLNGADLVNWKGQQPQLPAHRRDPQAEKALSPTLDVRHIPVIFHAIRARMVSGRMETAR